MPQSMHPRLAPLELAGFSGLALPLGALVISVAVYLPPHLATNLGLNMTVIGAAWATVRIIDLFVDPVLGLLMDRTQSRFGRYRPWIVVGGPILMLAFWALFEARRGISSFYLVGWLLALYLGQSILTMGQSAWAANLAPDYEDRSRVFGAIGIAAVLGMLAVLLVPILLRPLELPENDIAPVMGWFVVGLIPCAVALATLTTPEPMPATAVSKLTLKDLWALITTPDLARLFFAQLTLTLGPGWMSALFIFFFVAGRGFTTPEASILLLINIVAGVFGAWGLSRLAIRFGKHRALITAAIAFSLGLLTVPLIPRGSVIGAAPTMIWLGFMTAGFDVTIRAMLADVGDEVRLERGTDQLSLIYALNAVANKLGWALSIGLAFPLLAAIGFNPAEGAVNTAAALRGLEIVFLAGPVLFAMLGALCVAGWRLDARRHADIRRRLLTIKDANSAVKTARQTLTSAP